MQVDSKCKLAMRRSLLDLLQLRFVVWSEIIKNSKFSFDGNQNKMLMVFWELVEI